MSNYVEVRDSENNRRLYSISDIVEVREGGDNTCYIFQRGTGEGSFCNTPYTTVVEAIYNSEAQGL